MIPRALFALAKRPLLGTVVGHGFRYGSGLLPVNRVLETEQIIAFYHPKPAWP